MFDYDFHNLRRKLTGDTEGGNDNVYTCITSETKQYLQTNKAVISFSPKWDTNTHFNSLMPSYI